MTLQLSPFYFMVYFVGIFFARHNGFFVIIMSMKIALPLRTNHFETVSQFTFLKIIIVLY